MKVLSLGPHVNFKKIKKKQLVLGGELWAPNITKNIKQKRYFNNCHICKRMFFDDVFNFYEFQEKNNIEY